MILITKETTYSNIKELKAAQIQGIGLDINFYPIEEVSKAAESFLKGIPYWPNHIIEQLPGNKKKNIKAKTITPRQKEVLNLIKTRGSSNKQIARVLMISESTVKMHVSDIMNMFGVRSRVQLAVLNTETIDNA